MKFLADMGVSLRVVSWLRNQGYDVKHLREESLMRLPDEEIFSKGLAEQRVILTFDLDFGEIAVFSRKGGISVIVFRLRNTKTPHVIERLAKVLSDCEDALQSGSVIVVEESRHRVRHLPIR